MRTLFFLFLAGWSTSSICAQIYNLPTGNYLTADNNPIIIPLVKRGTNAVNATTINIPLNVAGTGNGTASIVTVEGYNMDFSDIDPNEYFNPSILTVYSEQPGLISAQCGANPSIATYDGNANTFIIYINEQTIAANWSCYPFRRLVQVGRVTFRYCSGGNFQFNLCNGTQSIYTKIIYLDIYNPFASLPAVSFGTPCVSSTPQIVYGSAPNETNIGLYMNLESDHAGSVISEIASETSTFSLNATTHGAGQINIRRRWNFPATFVNGPLVFDESFQPAGQVNGLPSITIGSADNFCDNSGSPSVATPSPAGGSWSGSLYISSDGSFNTNTAVQGSYQVTYNYTDGNGCSNTAQRSVNVLSLPNVNAGNDVAACDDSGTIALGGSPVGGTWSGSHVTGSSFDTDAATAGNYVLTYTYVHAATGCQNSDTKIISVNARPTVSAGVDFTACTSAGTVALTGGSPIGGTWSGSGVSGSTFNPNTAGVGAHNITYSYTDANGCSASDIRIVTVQGAPVVDAGINSSVCVGSQPLALVGVPEGGSWWGTGVVNSNFDASGLAPGNYNVTYTFTNASGCTNNDVRTITVNQLPVVEAGNNLFRCINDAEFNLTGASPGGGVWSGPGLNGPTLFNPTMAGVGAHVMTYTFTNGNGCQNSDTRTITIGDITSVSVGNDFSVCTNSAVYNLNQDLPAGVTGVWSGPGVSGGSNLNPAAMPIGSHTLTFTFTNAGSCVSQSTKTVTNVQGPSVDAGSLMVVCSNAGPVNLVGESPAGGSWSGYGVSGNQFNPNVTGPGIWLVTYTVNTGICQVSDTRQIEVTTPVALDAGPNINVCSNAPNFLLTGASRNGGIWSGPGVAGGFFSPASVAPGVYEITYEYTNVSGCVANDTRTITVNAAPVISAGEDFTMCRNESPYSLVMDVNIPGGIFNGVGVSGLNFNPTTANVGSHQITYMYTSPATGCSSSDFRIISVIAPEAVSIGSNVTACVDGLPFSLNNSAQSIAGGEWSGNGVNGNNFNPASVGAGAHVVQYSVVDANGCLATNTKNVNVVSLPVVEAGQDVFVCNGAPLVSLAGTAVPVGGTWSGLHLTASSFDVNSSGSGEFTVTYTYTNPSGCTNSDTKQIIVNAGAIVSAGPDFSVCQGDPLVDLASRVSPGGGSFVGPGVVGNNFNPSLGAGTYQVTYNLTNSYGCVGSDDVTITVNSLPTVNPGSDLSLCLNLAPVDLSLTAYPAGGVFMGPGVVNNFHFDPLQAGVGEHPVNYVYANAQGCQALATRTIIVTALPNVNAGSNDFMCISQGLVDLDEEVDPVNGAWVGPGVTSGIFNPQVAGVGIHTLRYTVTFGNGCSNFDEKIMTVLPDLAVNAGPDLQVCSNGGLVDLATGANHVGGLWSGVSVSSNVFNPSQSGPGNFNISYTLTDQFGCTAMDTKSIVVVSPFPVSVGSNVDVCVTAEPFNIAGSVFPAGGTFIGAGLIGNNFDPELAGVGQHAVNYTVVDPQGCTTSKQRIINVTNPAPINAGANQVICLSQGIQDLDLSAQPVGGSWSGVGVNGSFFNPSTANIGVHTISYTYDHGNGCIAHDTKTITVRENLTVDAGIDRTFCSNGLPFSFVNDVSRQGGTWIGPGLTPTGTFTPSVAGAGTHIVFYNYTDSYGCFATDTKTVAVNAAPSVSAGSDISLCNTASPLNLNGSVYPSGGSWTGPGLAGSLFNPVGVGNGSYNLVYHYTDANNCSSTDTRTIQVVNPPIVDTGSNIFVCVNSPLVQLDAYPSISGGSWSGMGVSNNIFDPQFANLGSHVLTYVYNNGAGCISTDTKLLTVRPAPVVNAGIDRMICANGAPFNLANEANLPGGLWQGPGVSQGAFSPAIAGVGPHVINYTYTDAFGCSATDLKTFVVNGIPLVDAGQPAFMCTTSPSIDLSTSAFPDHGTWQGAGVNASQFNPVSVGPGAFSLNYSVTNADGCTAVDQRSVTVQLPASVTVGANRIVCLNSGEIDLAVGVSRIGGTWTGNGVQAGTFFNPQVAGVGAHLLNYSVTEGTCTSVAQRTIEVRPSLTVNAGSDRQLCVNGGPINLQSDASVGGGVWSGAGITGSNFNPGIAGVGQHVVSLTYTDGFGCVATDQKIITVDDITAIDAGPALTICSTSSPIDLSSSVSQLGGTWSGSGVAANSFSPVNVGLGSFVLNYSLTNQSGCTSHDTRTITVVAPPPVNIGGNLVLCQNSPAVDLDLNVSQIGGTWSGNVGLDGSFFDASAVGVGNHYVTYTYDNQQGCISTATKTIQVRQSIVVDAGVDREVCINTAPIELGSDPSLPGGEWNGVGVSGSRFNPLVAGTGAHVLSYQYTDAFGCSAVDTRTIAVSALPDVNAGPDIVVCTEGDNVHLSTSGFPAGGTWSGQGVVSNEFLPETVGPGSYLLNYYYVGANGCAAYDQKEIEVASPPVVDAGANFEVCVNAAPLLLASAKPVGGSWSGPGVIAGVFDPLSAGLGVHELAYSYTDDNGCAVRDEIEVEVLEEPTLTIGDDLEVCMNQTPVNLLPDASIKGGSFSGPGVTGTVFNPVSAGEGTHVITYTARFNGCELLSFRNITVYSPQLLSIGSNFTMCRESDPYDLVTDVNVVGGVFIGDGVEGSVFRPEEAGIGSHVITYHYTNAFGCASSAFRVVTVQEQLPIYAGEDITLCASLVTYELTGRGTPEGGIYVGQGVQNNSFNPAVTGLGEFEIEYVVDNGNGCVSRDVMVITVRESSINNFGSDTIVCVTAAPLVLNFNDELVNGNWSGTGVVSNSFYPALAGLGSHVLSYHNQGLDCDIAGRRTMTVVGLPKAATSDVHTVSGCDESFVELEAEVSEQDRQNNVTVAWYHEDGSAPFATGEKVLYQVSGDDDVFFRALSPFGCTSGQNDYITVRSDNPSGDFYTEDVVIPFAKPIQFFPIHVNNASSFRWDFGDGLYSLERYPWKYYYESGEFNVSLTLTSPKGCESVVTKEKYIEVLPEPGREEVEAGRVSGRVNGDRLSVIGPTPNPHRGKFRIEVVSPFAGRFSITAINYLGQLFRIGEYDLIEGANLIEIDISENIPGVYSVVIQGSNNTVINFKTVKQ